MKGKKMKASLWLICILSSLLILSGCQQESMIHIDVDDSIIYDVILEYSGDLEVTSEDSILVWTYTPDVTLSGLTQVEGKTLIHESPANYPDSYLLGLTGPVQPDVLIIDMNDFGLFQDIQQLVDYSGLEGFSDWQDSLAYKSPLEAGRSRDGQHVYGVLYQYDPYVMYYRLDLLQTYGLLEEGFNGLEPPMDWFTDGEAFKLWIKKAAENDHYLFEWPNDPYEHVLMNKAYFEKDYERLLAPKAYEAMYEVSQYVHDNDFFLGNSIWTDAGITDLQNGRLEAVYQPMWGQYWLPQNVPDQSGSWRVAPLPWGAESMKGSMILINKNSQNKDIIYSYVKKLVENECQRFVNGRDQTYTFFGGQNVGDLYYQVVSNWHPKYHTNLDHEIEAVYYDLIRTALEAGKSFEDLQDDFLKTVLEINPFELDILQGNQVLRIEAVPGRPPEEEPSISD